MTGEMVVGFLPGEADGAIPNGSRIVKCLFEKGDGTPIGTGGEVIASHRLPDDFRRERGEQGHPNPEFFYFVKWDTHPDLPVGVGGHKIVKE